MTLNYTSHCAITRYLVDDMLKKESGHIVMVSSISGLYPTPLRTLYAGSKFGIDRFSNAVRAELSLKGIDVTVVSPSYVQTNISKNALKGDGEAFGALDENIKSGFTVDEAV